MDDELDPHDDTEPDPEPGYGPVPDDGGPEPDEPAAEAATVAELHDVRFGHSAGGDSGVADALERGDQFLQNDPTMAGVQQVMADTGEIYRDAMGTDHVPTSVESTQQFISNVMNASPEQLARMETQLTGMHAAEQIEQSVSEQHHTMLEREAEHQQTIARDRAEIEAESVISEAESLSEEVDWLLWRTS